MTGSPAGRSPRLEAPGASQGLEAMHLRARMAALTWQEMVAAEQLCQIWGHWPSGFQKLLSPPLEICRYCAASYRDGEA